MAKELTPIAAKEKTAAKLMDMSVAEFRNAVACGDLPDGRVIAGLKRWDTELLTTLIRGEYLDGWGEIKW